MTPLFADTSYYIAILNPRDRFHRQATALSDELRRGVVTTDFVLIEVANWLASSSNRGAFWRLLESIEADEPTSVVRADHELFVEGARVYRQRPDKEWSLTDCISFVVMKQQDLTEALTADRHFEQAGFRALLRS